MRIAIAYMYVSRCLERPPREACWLQRLSKNKAKGLSPSNMLERSSGYVYRSLESPLAQKLKIEEVEDNMGQWQSNLNVAMHRPKKTVDQDEVGIRRLCQVVGWPSDGS